VITNINILILIGDYFENYEEESQKITNCKSDFERGWKYILSLFQASYGKSEPFEYYLTNMRDLGNY
jgi:hypothetical protein